MKKDFDLDTNKTGIALSPLDKDEMLENSKQNPGSSALLEDLVEERAFYVQQSGPIGTVPPPASLKGVAKGKVPTLLLDKLGQRLAFERTGTRLYEGFIQKLEVLGPIDGVPDPALVQQFFREELSHMELVRQAIQDLGGDPTAVTPSANLDGVAALGLAQIISDPRTDIPQSLHAIHIAELADNDGWEMLIELAKSFGKDELVASFQRALEEEQVHLEHVREWMNTLTLSEAKIS